MWYLRVCVCVCVYVRVCVYVYVYVSVGSCALCVLCSFSICSLLACHMLVPLQLELIKRSCERIESLKTEIEGLHKNALMAVDAEEATRLARRVEASSTLVSAEAGTVRRLLKALDGETQRRRASLSSSDLRLRQAKHQAWCRKFLALMAQFEEMQSLYRQKYRQQMERQYLLVHPEATGEELERLPTLAPAQLSQQIFQHASRVQAQQTLDAMRERQVEIERIEKSISEIHQMFLDISFILTQQGFTIGKVDEYVQSSLEATEQASEAMAGAVVKQRKAQRRRWFFAGFGVLVLIALIVIIVVALTGGIGTNRSK
jgi:syntaxin 1B/2/3